MNTDINEVRSILECSAEKLDAAGSLGDYLRVLLADHARLQTVSQELAAALAGLTGFVTTDVLESCNGSKCRNPWCAGCFGEDDAERAAGEARNALDAARAAIDAAKAVQP